MIWSTLKSARLRFNLSDLSIFMCLSPRGIKVAAFAFVSRLPSSQFSAPCGLISKYLAFNMKENFFVEHTKFIKPWREALINEITKQWIIYHFTEILLIFLSISRSFHFTLWVNKRDKSCGINKHQERRWNEVGRK